MGLDGQLGRVVVLGKMSQARPSHSLAGIRFQELGCFEIGDMSTGAFTAFLEKLGIGTVGQHLGIVVALQ
jgi:hypothetical protein